MSTWLLVAVLALPAGAFEVVLEPGADAGRAKAVTALAESLAARYPNMSAAAVKLVYLDPARKKDNVQYCYPDGLNGDALCDSPGFGRAILIDLDFLDSFAARHAEFYKPGAAKEAVLFHELLHGWGYDHDGDEAAYEALTPRKDEFDERAERFDKKRDALGRAIQGQPPEVLEKYERRLKKADRKRRRPRGRLARKLGLPQRWKRDAHAVDNIMEWFAYGGEVHFYAARPDDLLRPEERRWWDAKEASFR